MSKFMTMPCVLCTLHPNSVGPDLIGDILTVANDAGSRFTCFTDWLYNRVSAFRQVTVKASNSVPHASKCQFATSLSFKTRSLGLPNMTPLMEAFLLESANCCFKASVAWILLRSSKGDAACKFC